MVVWLDYSLLITDVTIQVKHAEPDAQTGVDGEKEKFEVVGVAVDPSLQRSGLASRLCGEVEAELKEKARTKGKKQLNLMIRTGKENNEPYWTRKGYRVLSEVRYAPGNFGSKTGFVVLDMEKVIEL